MAVDSSEMSKKDSFISEYASNELSFDELCEKHGVSRKTGFAWLSGAGVGRSATVTAAPAGKEKTSPPVKNRTRSPMRYPQRVLLRALITVVIIWVMFGWIFGVTTAPSKDMYPRIDAGDLVLYYRLDKSVKAQDVVMLNKNDTDYIGRVVAVGGDTVEITDTDSLVINGSTMIESNIFYRTPIYEGFVEYPLTLGEGECFVLVDSRSGGEDSRYYGPVQENEILGTVITIVRRTNL